MKLTNYDVLNTCKSNISLLWIKYYQEKKKSFHTQWITKDKTRIQIYDLKDEHLVNIINFTSRKESSKNPCFCIRNTKEYLFAIEYYRRLRKRKYEK